MTNQHSFVVNSYVKDGYYYILTRTSLSAIEELIENKATNKKTCNIEYFLTVLEELGVENPYQYLKLGTQYSRICNPTKYARKNSLFILRELQTCLSISVDKLLIEQFSVSCPLHSQEDTQFTHTVNYRISDVEEMNAFKNALNNDKAKAYIKYQLA